MPETRRIAIVRGRDNATGTALTPELDRACEEMLVRSANPLRDSVLEYWTDNTDGNIRFEVTMLPWVDVQFTAAEVIRGAINRTTAFNKIKTATEALPGQASLAGYDGYICLVAPGASIPNPQAGQPGQVATFPFDGGAAGHGTAEPHCTLPIATSTHTFMCHEFGHVLGQFDDDGIPYGVGGDTGYGDPFSIMSAATFANSSPTYIGTPVPDWPNATAKNSMGPAPSRAVSHYWNPASQRPSFVTKIDVPSAAADGIRLYSAWTDAGAPRLLYVEPDVQVPYDIGRMYIEYRDSRKWDQGLETTGTNLDRRSVVIHVAGMRPLPDLGAGDTIGNRCYYRGRIVVPVEVDADFKVRGTPFTVRVVDANVHEGWAEVKITRSDPVGFEIDVSGADEITNPEGPVEVRRTPCGDSLHYATWLTVARFAFRPVAWGIGGAGPVTGAPIPPPTVVWTVGGVPIPFGFANGRLRNCQALVGVFDIDYRIDDTGTLHLAGTAPGQKFKMPVHATIADPTTGVNVAADAIFPATGTYKGLPWRDRTALLRCMKKTVSVFPPDLRDLRPPRDQPRPNWLQLTEHLLERTRMNPGGFAVPRAALEQLVHLAKLDH